MMEIVRYQLDAWHNFQRKQHTFADNALHLFQEDPCCIHLMILLQFDQLMLDQLQKH